MDELWTCCCRCSDAKLLGAEVNKARGSMSEMVVKVALFQSMMSVPLLVDSLKAQIEQVRVSQAVHGMYR